MKLSIKYPLKLKLVILLTLMLFISLSVFVTFAVQIFRADKSAYVFDALLAKANTEKIIFANKIKAQRDKLLMQEQRLMLGDKTLTREDLFSSQQELIRGDLIIPHQGKFYILGDKLQLASPEKVPQLQSIFDNKVFESVREIIIDKTKYLIAYSYNSEFNFIITTMIAYDLAFSATDELIQRSLFFGSLLLGICLILSVLLVRPLTKQLENLFIHTQKISSGDFKSRLEVRGNDEVSALTHSVNDMSEQIENYVEEMKEKARLANEVAVAQLVQSSFFPNPSYDDEKLSFFAHYRPASECGGDWWGVFHTTTHKVFFIADATGHGVPAALLTATMNCCKTSLNFILESRPELLQRPDEIMRFMNQAVIGAGKEIQVTCFIAILEMATHKLTYSNASHPAPLIFNSTLQTLEKSDISPLQASNGPRLGERIEATYTNETRQLQAHDTILLYTDGIIEALNADGKRWGERRLLNVITDNYKQDCRLLLTSIMSSLEDFMNGSPQDDDFTAVSFKVKS